MRMIVPAAALLLSLTGAALAQSADPRDPYRAGTGGAAATAPNVLVLVVDALRARQVPAYGYPRGRMPHLDRFARNGLLFERMIAQGSRTKESTASMLTGVHASRLEERIGHFERMWAEALGAEPAPKRHLAVAT